MHLKTEAERRCGMTPMTTLTVSMLRKEVAVEDARPEMAMAICDKKAMAVTGAIDAEWRKAAAPSSHTT